jgi:hypothetical protein
MIWEEEEEEITMGDNRSTGGGVSSPIGKSSFSPNNCHIIHWYNRSDFSLANRREIRSLAARFSFSSRVSSCLIL